MHLRSGSQRKRRLLIVLVALAGSAAVTLGQGWAFAAPQSDGPAKPHTSSTRAASGVTDPTPTPDPTPVPVPVPTDGQNEVPGDVLDLTDWYVTLPSGAKGTPDTVEQPALDSYSSRWFQLDAAGRGVVFTAEVGGVTTKNSSYPRSELREMNGAAKASWSNKSGTHVMRIRQAVTELPVAKPQVVTAQIHDASDDVVLVRLDRTRLEVRYDDGRKSVLLDSAYQLGTMYDLEIVAAGSRIKVYYNGVKKADIGRSGSGWYFKSGSYVQSNTSKGDKADAVGQVVIQSLTVTHTG